MMQCGIYCILNKATNKRYVGSAFEIKSRNNNHLHELKSNKHHNKYLQNSFNKHGEKNFEFSIVLEIVEKDNKLLEEREQFWMDHYQSYNRDNGYNQHPKAHRLGFTEEVKKKISQSRIGKESPMKGKKMSDESKRKMSLAKKGKYFGSNNPMFGKQSAMKGKKQTEESNRKNSLAHKGIKKGPISNKQKLSISSRTSGTIWIHNAYESKRIFPKDLSNYSNWCLGKIRTS